MRFKIITACPLYMLWFALRMVKWLHKHLDEYKELLITLQF
jgi:hypothetical protein